MRVAITIDLEQDCPPFRSTFRGVEEGMPRLLQILEDEMVPATFFTVGMLAEHYPKLISDLTIRGHEIACHGHTHARFDRIDERAARLEISESTKTLRKFYPVVSFRAPNLKFPDKYLSYLVEEGYKIDSTLARHKNPFVKIHSVNGILRVPVSTTSILLRMPSVISDFFLGRFRDPIVIFFHPWEFVDLRREKLRLDCRFNTGEGSLNALRNIISFYKSMGASFIKIQDLISFS